jgi:nucleoside-diphosphate-sugar epimerase
MSEAAKWPAFSGAGAERLKQGDERVIVTGAGGWLGLATLEMLHGLLGKAFHRRVACFGARERTLTLRGGVEIAQSPLDGLSALGSEPSILLHLAFLTQEKAKTMSPEAYAAANWGISLKVMTALNRIGVQAAFLASSGAVYLADNKRAPRSKRLYGGLKMEDEARFVGWAEDTGKQLVIARIFNLSGPYINKRSSYALASFIADALADRPIQVTATHKVYRSYVAIEEMMSVALGALTANGSGIVTFDTAGDGSPELEGIAHAVADTLRPQLKVWRGAIGREATDRYVGDAAKYDALRQLFGVRPVSFADQIRQTAAFMSEWPDEPE